MTAKNIESGDINIIKVELFKSMNSGATPVDVRPQIVSLSIFEDVEHPTMQLEVTLIDSLNLVQDYPIVGEETITVSYFTPGRDKISRKGFLVYSVEGTGVHPTSKASIYTIKAVSPLHFINASTLIEKSYKDTIDNIVKDIVTTVIESSQTSQTNFSVEPTKGILPVTIPRLTPFQAIDFLRQKAISMEYASGGSYLFFENQFGLQFKSIEKIISENKPLVETKVFTYNPDTLSDKQRQQYNYRNILRYNHLTKFDSIQKLASGTINNVVESFDVLTKKTELTEFKISEKSQTFVSTDDKGRIPNTPAFIDKFTNKFSKKFYVPKDTSRGNDFIDSFMGTKSAFSNLLNQNAVRVLINGDSFMSAGDLVELNLPEVSGTTDKKNADTLSSGKYLVTKLRHLITIEEGSRPKHRISMDCVRMGYK